MRLAGRLGPQLLTPASDGRAEDLAPDNQGIGQRALLGLIVAVAALAASSLIVIADNHLGWSLVVAVILVVAWSLTGLRLLSHDRLWRLGAIVMAGVGAAAVAVAAAVAGASGANVESAGIISVVVLPAFGFHLLVGLPDGRLSTAPRRRAVVAGYAGAVIAGLAFVAAGVVVTRGVMLVEAVITAALALTAASRAYRRADTAARAELRWLACASVLFADLAIVTVSLRALVGWPRPAGLMVALASVVIPAALGATTFPGRLARTGRLVMATVFGTAVMVIIGMAYVVMVLALARVPDRDERAVLLLSLLVSGGAVATYVAAHERLSDLGRVLAHGDRPPPEELLRSFESRLSRAVPLEELLRQASESLFRSMDLAAAEIWTGSDGLFQQVVSIPERSHGQLVLDAGEEEIVARAGPSGPGWARVWIPGLLAGREDQQLLVVPVASSGELLGLIVVERTARAEPFSDDEHEVLADLARAIGSSLLTVRLDAALQESIDEVRRQARELQESRARIVAASDETRRRIERDLHDGVQQHLLALHVKLGLARRLAASDASATERLLDELSADVQQVTQELRNLAHGIYPSLLTDRGLGEALGSAATQAPIPTRVEARGLHRYPSEVEAAVYFCCAEALHNAAKHGGPSVTATVRVWEEPRRLLFEIADDGAGFDSSCPKGAGAGLVNMIDRIGAVGGRLDITSTPGNGTCVSGRIPLGVRMGATAT